MDPIAQRIRQLLQEKGWSARKLAIESQLSEKAVTKILNRGGMNARVETLIKISTGAEVSLIWLILGEDPWEQAARSVSSGKVQFPRRHADVPGWRELVIKTRLYAPETDDDALWRHVGEIPYPIMRAPLNVAMAARFARMVMEFEPIAGAKQLPAPEKQLPFPAKPKTPSK